MPDISAFIPDIHQDVSAGYVDTLIQERRLELFTGLMRLHYLSGQNLVLTFLEGVQQSLYRCLDKTVDVMPRHAWFDTIDHATASVGVLSLPVEAMRFARVVYEAPVVRVENSTLTPAQLAGAANAWTAGQEPGVVHVQGGEVDAYYLITGHSAPMIESLAFVERGARFSIVDASFTHGLPQGEYAVTHYVSTCEHEVWNEYELRIAFNPLMRILLNRFSELAGRVLTDRMCENLSIWAHEEGWKITITSNGAVNRHYFDSLEVAAGVYANLLRRFREEAAPAIGSRMVDNISRETLTKLDPYRRELLVQHLYAQPGVGSAAGVVWR